MSLLTYFKATLPCSHGGHVGTAWIPSKLGSRGATYQVGDCPGADIPTIDFEDTSFVVRPPAPGEPIHVLLSWTCETCRLESFAEVVLADGCVRAIDAVDLTPETLARIHYIAEGLEDMVQAVVGEPLQGGPAEWIDQLRRAVHQGRRWGL